MMKYLVRLLVIPLLAVGAIFNQGDPDDCRDSNRAPHLTAMWSNNFPQTNGLPKAKCQGTITVNGDGSVCVTGRVSYRQLAEAVRSQLNRAIFAPAAETISVNGHMTSGSANFALGSDAGYLYDYVTSYTVDGTDYMAGPGMIDNLLGASRGTIEAFCLSSDFTQPDYLYSVSHKFWIPFLTNTDKLRDANLIYGSSISIVGEYLRRTDSGFFDFLLLPLGSAIAWVLNLIVDITPNFIFRFLPLIGAAGVFRFFLGGSLSTQKDPQPLLSPGGTAVENWGIDTEWETVIAAMADGLFTRDLVPPFLGVTIRKITPSASPNGCWTETSAILDVQGPEDGDAIDDFVNNVILPKLLKFGTVGLHFGKRIQAGSPILDAALDKYGTCGAELNVEPATCIHPMCRRSTAVSTFEWAPGFYA